MPVPIHAVPVMFEPLVTFDKERNDTRACCILPFFYSSDLIVQIAIDKSPAPIYRANGLAPIALVDVETVAIDRDRFVPAFVPKNNLFFGILKIPCIWEPLPVRSPDHRFQLLE